MGGATTAPALLLEAQVRPCVRTVRPRTRSSAPRSGQSRTCVAGLQHDAARDRAGLHPLQVLQLHQVPLIARQVDGEAVQVPQRQAAGPCARGSRGRAAGGVAPSAALRRGRALTGCSRQGVKAFTGTPTHP